MAQLLRPVGHWLWLSAEILLLSALILLTRCANYENVFVAGKIYFADPDCYARMTRARLVAAHPGLVVRHHDFENYPAGASPHTTAPLDYLIVGLAALLGPLTAQPLDLAGAAIGPLLALLGGWFLWWWSRRAGLRYRWVGLLLYALSPILAHGAALGRPDHQALLLFLLVIAFATEWMLQEKPSRGLAITSGLTWGLALWTSLYEPALLFTGVFLGGLWRGREKLWAPSRRLGWSVLCGVLLVAGLVERRWPQLPDPALHAFYERWSATIGELQSPGLTNPLWLHWFGGFLLLTPLFLFLAGKRRPLPLGFFLLFALTLLLTIWEARWGYFLALILVFTTPALFVVVRQRWLALTLIVLASLPCLHELGGALWPNEQTARRRGEARAAAVEWRALAEQTRGAFLAPWWLTPAAAYWSGRPGMAGSSHESLPGIEASARFFLATEPNEAAAILRRHRVRWVLVTKGEDVTENAATLVGLPIPRRSYALLLDRTPGQAPPFLVLEGQNGRGKAYRVRQ